MNQTPFTRPPPRGASKPPAASSAKGGRKTGKGWAAASKPGGKKSEPFEERVANWGVLAPGAGKKPDCAEVQPAPSHVGTRASVQSPQ